MSKGKEKPIKYEFLKFFLQKTKRFMVSSTEIAEEQGSQRKNLMGFPMSDIFGLLP